MTGQGRNSGGYGGRSSSTCEPMAKKKALKLDSGYTSEVDAIDEQDWYQVLERFDDANIYQTWAYAAVTCGRRNVSHLILRKDGVEVAIAQARIAKLPLLNVGIAYIHWGPLWRRDGIDADMDVFRQAIRALRIEFVHKRGLVLRLFPVLYNDDPPCLKAILADEGFSPLAQDTPGRTVLMDLRPSIENLHEGMKSHWKRELKVAERKGLEVIEGSGEPLFDSFIDIYREMVSRKRFVEPNDINQFRVIQAQLPERFKMKILLAKTGDDICSGLICGAIGKTAIYLFGATSNTGMKSRGSYLLQWRLLESLKQGATTNYNLNGINPEKNPGTYKFKSDLSGQNGKDVYYMGRFDSRGSVLSSACVDCGEMLRKLRRTFKESVNAVRGGRLSPREAN